MCISEVGETGRRLPSAGVRIVEDVGEGLSVTIREEQLSRDQLSRLHGSEGIPILHVGKW